MGILWAITLVIYGAVNGFPAISPLFWWLLVPMLLQDIATNNKK